MPRGQPDYGITTQTPVASGISDPGEAAARLGSINVYDRRGWTVWMDDFEGPVLKWNTNIIGDTTEPVLSTDWSWMGEQSVYFVTAAVDDEFSGMNRIFPLLRTGRVGKEFFIRHDSYTPFYFRSQVAIHDGTNQSRSELRLDTQAQTATIVTAAGNIVVATNCFNTVFGRTFMPVKLVIDMDTDHYVRLMIGPREWDISAHELVIVKSILE